jgi:hypothetical protein
MPSLMMICRLVPTTVETCSIVCVVARLTLSRMDRLPSTYATTATITSGTIPMTTPAAQSLVIRLLRLIRYCIQPAVRRQSALKPYIRRPTFSLQYHNPLHHNKSASEIPADIHDSGCAFKAAGAQRQIT